MEFIKERVPYIYSDVVRTTVDGVSYRVARKRPDDPKSLALCECRAAGTGWAPVRDLTEDEMKEYEAFMNQSR